MSALFWDQDYSSPPGTPPLLVVSSEFRNSSLMRSPVQDNHDNLGWTVSEQVEVTRLNPSRTKDRSEGEWHMVTASRSWLGSDRRDQREDLQACRKLSYSSLPRAHFLQPNRESSAFSPYTNDLRLNCKDARNIAESPGNSPKLHPLTQPGFLSPKIPHSKHCEAAQSAKKALERSSISNTLPLPCSKTAVLRHSHLCSKPQKVKTSVVKTPPLMRAVISQTSLNSTQSNSTPSNSTPSNSAPSNSAHLSKKHFGQRQLKENHHVKNQDQSSPHIKNYQLVWSPSQPTSSLFQPEQSQDFPTENVSVKDHLSINTHLFPERRSEPGQTATISPSLQKASQERFSLSVEPRPHASLTQPNDSQTQKHFQYLSIHQEDGDSRNSSKNHVNSQVDMNSKNVFGQPRVIASLRAACSPRAVRKSTVLEDLKKLIVMDDAEDGPQANSLSSQPKGAELCSGSPMSGSCASPANQSYPESPALTPTHLTLQTRPTECWPVSEADLWERHQDLNPELMPLPSTACHLDWNSLVQAAQAYETQRMATLLSEMSPISSRPETPSQGTYKIHQSNAYYSEEDTDDVFVDFPDQLSHLEGMLRRLSSDLLKEKRDKVALLAEVLKLRISNQQLKEESFCACAQLHEISRIVNADPEGVE